MRKQILDVGCGTGFRTQLLSKRGEVIGIDISDALLRDARRNFPSLQFQNMSAEDLKFPNGMFDEIYCFDVLEHVDHLDETIQGLARALKPAGSLIIEVPYWRSEILLKKIYPSYWDEVHHVRMFRPGDLDNLLRLHGFTLVRTHRLRFITNLELILGFLTGRRIANQEGVFDRPLPFLLMASLQLFNVSLFTTRLKYIPLWGITLPVAKILDQIFPKTIQYLFEKITE